MSPPPSISIPVNTTPASVRSDSSDWGISLSGINEEPIVTHKRSSSSPATPSSPNTRNRWASTSSRLLSSLKRSPTPSPKKNKNPRPYSKTSSPNTVNSALTFQTNNNKIAGSYVYKRNKRFGYTRRFLAIDVESGVFFYFSSYPTEEEMELTIDDLKSSIFLKSQLLPSEWTLSDAPDDPTGFFVFRGAGAANLQSKSGRANSLFFKVIEEEEGMTKGEWVEIATKLSARGTDQFLHSHISIKGLANVEKVKRTRKTTKIEGQKIESKLGSSSKKKTTTTKVTVAEEEHKVKPRRHYPNLWMTDEEMMKEVIKPTQQIQDTTARNPSLTSLGLVEVELLQCFGLPKMDRFGKTDAYGIFVLGDTYFRSDTIDDNYSPIFLPRCRRGARFNITVPYERLYVSIYDDDGSFASDDYIGRVEIDLSRLTPHLTYDVSLALRDSDSIYSRKSKGVVRLRIKITDWKSDAVIARSWIRNFFRRQDGGQIVVTDKPMARQIANTCWGSEVPGEYSARLFKATIREFDLYEINFIHLVKKTLWEVAFYESPKLGVFKSLYVLAAWLWVAEDGFRAGLVSFLVFVIISLCENYYDRPAARTPLGFRTAKESKGNESQAALSSRASLVISRSYSNSSINPVADSYFSSNNASNRNSGDFPFCNTSLYPERGFDESLSRNLKNKNLVSLLEQKTTAAIDHMPTFRESSDSGVVKIEEDEDDEDDDDNENIHLSANRSFLLDRHLTSRRPVTADMRSTFNFYEKHIEQDEKKNGRSSSIINKFIKYRNRANLATLGLVADKIFSYEGGGTCGSKVVTEEATLKSQSSVNPVTAMKTKYMTPVQVGFKIAVAFFRALHSIATWKNTTITAIVVAGLVILTVIAFVFPFGLLFKAVGVAFVGPQNYLVSWYNHTQLLREQAKASDATDQLKRAASEVSSAGSVMSLSKTDKKAAIKKIFSKSSDAEDKGKLKKLVVHLPRRNVLDCSRFSDDLNLFEASTFYAGGRVGGEGDDG